MSVSEESHSVSRHHSSDLRTPVAVNGGTMSASTLAVAVEQSARAAVIAMDLDGVLIHASPAFCALTGWSQQELLGAQPPLPFWPPERANANSALVQAVLAGEPRPNGYESVMVRKNGERFDAHSLITRLMDDQGQHIGWVNSVRDVSRERAVERQIRGIADALTASPEGLALADAEDRYIYVNEMFAELCGLTVAQVLGKCWPDLSEGHVRAATDGTLAGTLHDPKVGTLDHDAKVEDATGGVRWISIRAVALWGPNRTYLGHIAQARDVTHRRQHQEDLLKLRTAVEASAEAIYITDPNGIITYANPGFTRLYGHDLDDIIGKVTPRILKSGVHGPERYAQFWQTILAKKPIKGEITNRTMEGRLVDVESTVDPILDADGAILGFVSIQRDMSERKALTAQLNQAQKMEALGRLAGGVAHDFNNVLSVVLSYTDFLMDEVSDRPDLVADVREIRQAGERAAALTRQLLVFSRKETARPEIVDLNAVIANVEKMLRRTIGEDVHLLWDPTPELPFIKADPGHLEQVLMNLAVNARDAMHGGGQLVLATDCLEIEEAAVDTLDPMPAGRYCLLEVRDTGCGMPSEVLEHAFDPFFTTKEQGKGTGLGLSIVYGMVRQSGGAIGVESVVGRGTTFRIYLPVTDEIPMDIQPLPQGVTHRGQGETVLLVEDEDAVRALAERILLRAGYRVLDARGGGEALLICERHSEHIDVLLTDVVMPQLSGTELAERIQRLRPNIKVLYMSGYAHAGVDAGAGAGPLGTPVVVRKPLDRETLLTAIDRVLGRRQQSGAYVLKPRG